MDAMSMEGATAFLGGGGSGAPMRTRDRAVTPFGAPASWPQPLRARVGVVPAAEQPMSLPCGPEHRLLCNDGHAGNLGRKSPAMGQPFEEVRWEILGDVRPILERSHAGEPTHGGITLVMQRHGHPEEIHVAGAAAM